MRSTSPKTAIASSADRQARTQAAEERHRPAPGAAAASPKRIGYPVVIRPSYVLGGRAMEIVHDGAEVDRYIARLSATLDRPSELVVSDKRPLLIDSYLTDAVEVDVDCLSRRQGHVRRRHHGAHRGSRHSFRRQRLLAAAAFAVAGDHRRTRAPDARAGARAARRRADERAVRDQGRARSSSSRSIRAPPAPCRSSPRSSACRSPRSPPKSWRASRWRRSI